MRTTIYAGGYMAAENSKRSKSKMVKNGSAGGVGFVFFLAWVGALVYFVQQSEGFWGFILAILKSFVWPAYVIHAVLGLLNIK
jgi:hypothetical protein